MNFVVYYQELSGSNTRCYLFIIPQHWFERARHFRKLFMC